jgi:hypothetical protein
METDGYTALQIGVGEAKYKRVNISKRGHYERAGVKPKRKLMEFRVTPDCLLPIGTTIHAQHFLAGQLVDVCGISKGRCRLLCMCVVCCVYTSSLALCGCGCGADTPTHLPTYTPTHLPEILC